MHRSCSNGFLPTRLIVGVMTFTACFVSYMLLVNMSITIITMVEPAQLENGSRRRKVAECAEGIEEISYNSTNSSSENLEEVIEYPDYGIRYPWNAKIQGLILGSYFWGYVLTSIPGGFLAEHFGPTKVVGTSGIVSASLTILIPWAASWHYLAVIAVRFLTGVLGGITYPAVQCLISRWAPPTEKGKFTATIMGGTFGTVITWPVVGSVIEAWGWKWGFYGTAMVAITWCCLWVCLVADSPEEHPRISEEEKNYIAKSLEGSVDKIKSFPPYLQMFTCVPFWALNVLHFGNLWGLNFLITAGPKYISEVLDFDVGQSGVLAALPYLARISCGFVFGCAGDAIRKHGWASITATRKAFVVVSHLLPGLLLLALTFAGCNAVLSVALITTSFGLNGAASVTNLQNNQDLAPNFAGTIYGIINSFGSTTGFITPALTGYLTYEHNGLREWHTIFCIGASVYIATGLVFCLFGTGEQQPWNNSSNNTNKVADECTDRGTENTRV